MANTSSRTLRLLSLLQTHRYWPGGELADRLEVSVRTLRRDIERLRELGYPVNATRGVDGGYQLAAGAALPPLVLDDEEAVAIAVGLQTAAQAGIAGIAETSVRALGKVAAVMPPRLRKRVEALGAVTQPAVLTGGPAADPRILTGLAEACRAEERIEFGYTAADGARTDRLAEPMRLVPLGRRWYLVAYDLHRHDWRSFRLDRMGAPSRTGVRFRPRELPAEDAAAYVRSSVARTPSRRIEFLVDAPEERVRAAIGPYAHIESDGAATVVRMETESLDWPAMAIAVLGAPVTVVEPPELVEHVARWAENLGRVRGVRRLER
ncbi:helix-turn-helix transcriptional regulator [Tsukamurella spumae]|uniref:YafY family transcriptional regulator n=1 Tax=Tsukamurella spumae TaxID=44753 RepID=A0A846WYB6_9ACTN|nr:YafY family protein [Tsukamurella spumae]NKY17881.1 YafY family transcriptional regulator [Tsukamurella spumae]